MRHLLLLAAAALLASCMPADDSATTTTAPVTTTAAPSTTQAPAATTTTTSVEVPSSPCLEGDTPFASGDVISAFGSPSGDAAQISGIRATRYPGCERVVVELLTADGAPAGSLGLAGVEYAEIPGIVRVNLPIDITQSAITNLLIDGDLARAAFVVRTRGGNLAIDIHVVSGVGIDLRAFEVDGPSRVVVDLRPNPGASQPTGALLGESVIVIESIPDPVTGTFTIGGYARVPDGELVVSVHADRAAEPLQAVVTPVVQSPGTWGEFALTIRGLPPEKLEIYVGDDSTDDGTGRWFAVDMTGDDAAGSTAPDA